MLSLLLVTGLSLLHLSTGSIQLPERNGLRFKRQFGGSNNAGFDWNSGGTQNGGMIWNGDTLLPTTNNDFLQNQNFPNPSSPFQNGNNNGNNNNNIGGQFPPNGNNMMPNNNWNGDSFLPPINNPNTNINLPIMPSNTPNPMLVATTTIAIPGMGTTRSACEDRCQVTSQYNPVCGDNNVTYTNIQWLICAQRCGRRVNLKLRRACPTT